MMYIESYGGLLFVSKLYWSTGLEAGGYFKASKYSVSFP